MSGDVKERILFCDFGYRAKIRRVRHRLQEDAILRDTAALAVREVSRTAVETAYVVREGNAARRREFEVLQFQGRLYWPLDADQRTEERLLSGIRIGHVNPFGENLLSGADVALDDCLDIAWADTSGRGSMLADMQRKSSDLLFIAGRLHLAGGVPLIALVERELVVVSSGSSRAGRPLQSGLTLQPGLFGSESSDQAFSANRVWSGSEFATVHIMRSPAMARTPPVIEEVTPKPVDWFVLRLDAAFRQIDRLWQHKRELTWQWDDLGVLLARGLALGSDLDQRRMDVIWGATGLFGRLWFDRYFPGASRKMLRLIDLGMARGLSFDKSEMVRELTDEECAALASLAPPLVPRRPIDPEQFDLDPPLLRRWRRRRNFYKQRRDPV